MLRKQSDINCMLMAGSIGEFYQALDLKALPDILVISRQVGNVDSLGHLEKISKMMPEVPILLMTNDEKTCMIQEALRMGVCGSFSKTEPQSQLLKAIRDVCAGYAYLSPKASKIAIEMIRGKRLGADNIGKRLSWTVTNREEAVIRGLIEGKSYKEIAATNFMTIDGVRYYIRSIYPKLGVSNRDQLVRLLTRE